MSYRQGRRRNMRKFTLGEVSFVDRPAQTPATADIAKASVEDLLNDDFELEKAMTPREGETERDFVQRFMDSDEMSDKSARERTAAAKALFKGSVEKRGDLVHMATGSAEGHEHGISIHGSGEGIHIMVHFAAAEDGQTHDHQIVRQADGTYKVTENQGHSHEIDAAQMGNVLLAAMNKAAEDDTWDDVPMELGGVQLADLPEVQKASEATADQGDTDMSAEDLKKAQDAQAAAEAKVATLEKVAALSGAHKAHYDAMDETLDDEARKAFLDMDEAARDAAVAKAADAAKDGNPVIYKAANGTEYFKNDDPRLVDMAKERDAERKEAAVAKAAAQDADLTKRAEGDLKDFPGSVDVRKAILKAVDGIEDEDLRKGAHDALKARNASNSDLTTIGTSESAVTKSSSATEAEGELDHLAKEMQASADFSGDYFDAYQKVADANPELAKRAVQG